MSKIFVNFEFVITYEGNRGFFAPREIVLLFETYKKL